MKEKDYLFLADCALQKLTKEQLQIIQSLVKRKQNTISVGLVKETKLYCYVCKEFIDLSEPNFEDNVLSHYLIHFNKYKAFI
jgi:hypothetical protein